MVTAGFTGRLTLESGIPPPPLPIFLSAWESQYPFTLYLIPNQRITVSMDYFSEAESYSSGGREGTLCQHLGYSQDARLAIVGADDFGLCSETNRAVVELYRLKRLTSTTIMTPAPGFADAVAAYGATSGLPCGVHIALTSDYRNSPTSPVSDPESVPSLLMDGAHFHFSVADFFKHANPADAEREAAAQIEKALANGIDVTHLDSHAGTLQLRPEFAAVYLRLAVKYRLPLRMASRSLIMQVGLPGELVDLARCEGLHFPDNFIYIPLVRFTSLTEKVNFLEELIDRMPPGLTEFYFHPAFDSPEARRLADSTTDVEDLRQGESAWLPRIVDYQLLSSGWLQEALAAKNVTLIDYRPLRDLVRQA